MALLSEFYLKIKHIKGKKNRVADALSRSMKMIHLATVSTCETNVRKESGMHKRQMHSSRP
jgi:hypothetical protein